MAMLTIRGKTYEVDDLGYLLDHRQWTEDFAAHMAPQFGVTGGLTERHLQVLRFLRQALEATGRCPLIYQTCRQNGLKLRDLKELFPTGYWRGACKLAGLDPRAEYMRHETFLPIGAEPSAGRPPVAEKIYRVDVRGFLADPAEWDMDYALHKAQEMKMPAGLTHRHWQVLNFLRDRFAATGKVPSVFETCEAHGLEIDELASLFPDGYQRGAVKLAGLRLR